MPSQKRSFLGSHRAGVGARKTTVSDDRGCRALLSHFRDRPNPPSLRRYGVVIIESAILPK